MEWLGQNAMTKAFYSSSSSASNSDGSPRRRIWPELWPARMQCGPLASRETTATSHGRARYAAATHPHGRPSSASSSKMVPVGLTELDVTAWTAIPTSRTSPGQPPGATDNRWPLLQSRDQLSPLDRFSVALVPRCREPASHQQVLSETPCEIAPGRGGPCGRHSREYPKPAELLFEKSRIA